MTVGAAQPACLLPSFVKFDGGARREHFGGGRRWGRRADAGSGHGVRWHRADQHLAGGADSVRRHASGELPQHPDDHDQQLGGRERHRSAWTRQTAARPSAACRRAGEGCAGLVPGRWQAGPARRPSWTAGVARLLRACPPWTATVSRRHRARPGRTRLVGGGGGGGVGRGLPGTAGAGGEEMWAVNLLLGGQTEEQVLSLLMSSQEFYDRAQTLNADGTADQQRVQAAVPDFCWVAMAGAAEVAGWVSAASTFARAGSGGCGRGDSGLGEVPHRSSGGYYNEAVAQAGRHLQVCTLGLLHPGSEWHPSGLRGQRRVLRQRLAQSDVIPLHQSSAVSVCPPE